MLTINTDEIPESIDTKTYHNVKHGKGNFCKYGGPEWNVKLECAIFRSVCGYAEVAQTTNGEQALIMESMGQPIKPNDRLNALTKLPEVLYNFHKHKVPPSIANKVGTYATDNPWNALYSRVNSRKHKMPESNARTWVLDELTSITWSKDYLIGNNISHGDVHLGNLVKSKDGIYKLIDFEWATLNSKPEYDISTLIYSTLYREEEYFPGYDPVTLYPKELNIDLVDLGLLYKIISGLSNRLSNKGTAGFEDLLGTLLQKHERLPEIVLESLSKYNS